MAWFKREKDKVTTTEKKSSPDGLWDKCSSCDEILFRRELGKMLWVCPKCGYHFRIPPREYLPIVLDDGPVEELNPLIRSTDPLQFQARSRYSDQLAAAMEATGNSDVMLTFAGTAEGKPLVVAAMDFSFIGGSMGSAVGEKFSRAVDCALERRASLFTMCASGGARMQEGVLSLMQLAKTVTKLDRFMRSGGIHITLLTDPTTGGVTASFGMLADVILAEPGALIGFAGPRVIKQTIGEELPQGFQRAEFLLEKGFVDRIVHRKDLRGVLRRVLSFAHA